MLLAFGLAQCLTGLAGHDLGRLPADAPRSGHGPLVGQIVFGLVIAFVAIVDWWWMRRGARRP